VIDATADFENDETEFRRIRDIIRNFIHS
jgi:hypothetical protein